MMDSGRFYTVVSLVDSCALVPILRDKVSSENTVLTLIIFVLSCFRLPLVREI